ncbi:MAG TPA: hypothetical protein VEV84_09340 [Pyrinomonadaceae bacterium]|nr:hypothetical protein [Pyrinomonadaceae bacterium]
MQQPLPTFFIACEWVYVRWVQRTVSVLIFLLLACANALAQGKPNSECPHISVIGPPGIIGADGIINFSGDVKPSNKYSTKYRWTTDRGIIVSGQGTSAIRVHVSDRGLTTTATLQVDGLPPGCPNSASEKATDMTGPGPIKLGEFTSPLNVVNNDRFVTIADAARKSPNSQLYIFIPPDVRVQNEVADRLERAIPESGIDAQRITFVHTNGKNSVIQIWLVPPGATPPKCEDCEPPAPIAPMAPANCPTLEVTGPSGITALGGIMPFAVIVSDPSLRKLTFAWTVSAGTIVEGQGTRVIKVRAPAGGGPSVSATVSVGGLPNGCISASSYKK